MLRFYKCKLQNMKNVYLLVVLLVIVALFFLFRFYDMEGRTFSIIKVITEVLVREQSQSIINIHGEISRAIFVNTWSCVN